MLSGKPLPLRGVEALTVKRSLVNGSQRSRSPAGRRRGRCCQKRARGPPSLRARARMSNIPQFGIALIRAHGGGDRMRFNRLGACLLVVLPTLPTAAMAQAPADAVRSSPVIAALPDPGAIPLYGNRTPGHKNTETWFRWYEGQAISVRNVTSPTL